MLENRVRFSDESNARERVRARIKSLLGTTGITNRAFGRAFPTPNGKGHVDTWVTGLLQGKFSLSLDELDTAAKILKTTAAALVQQPLDHAEYLTPSERRIVESIRALPPSIRDHFLTLAEYLIGVAPSEIEYLREYRQLTEPKQAKVRHWTHALLLDKEPEPGLAILPDHPATNARPTETEHRTRRPRRKR